MYLYLFMFGCAYGCLPLDRTKCHKHDNKKLEAYCKDDCTLLCIGCILHDNHKDHTLLSIDQAFEQSFGDYKYVVTQANEVKGSLNHAKEVFEEKVHEVENGYQKSLQQVNVVFNELIKKIKDR